MSSEKQGDCCPICSSEDVVLFHDVVWQMPEGRVFRCSHCEAAFLVPMMSDAEEQAFYQSYNEHVRARGVMVSHDPQELHERSRTVAVQRLAVINRYFTDAEKVLEIGSATGAFLELLNGKMCCCVEPDPENRAFAQQFVQRAYSRLEDISTEESFDVICLFHVFEHIKKPDSFLRTCARLLKESGWLIIEVPCLEDPLITLYDCKEFKDFYFQPMHPFVYNPKTLRYLFRQGAFKEQELIYYQRYGLDNHLAWLSRKKPGGDPLLSSLFADNEKYRQVLVAHHRTDTLFYIARKQGRPE